MIDRRSILTAITILPAQSLFGDVPRQLGASVQKTMAAITCDAARKWVAASTREYDPKGGFLGRGQILTVDEALFVLPALCGAGFIPYRHSWMGNKPEGRFHPIYGCDGSLCATVWHAFVRERDGKHEIVTVEHWDEHLAEFRTRTGLTLAEAMENPVPVESLTDGTVVPVGYTRERWASGRAIRAGVYDVGAYKDELLGK